MNLQRTPPTPGPSEKQAKNMQKHYASTTQSNKRLIGEISPDLDKASSGVTFYDIMLMMTNMIQQLVNVSTKQDIADVKQEFIEVKQRVGRIDDQLTALKEENKALLEDIAQLKKTVNLILTVLVK